MGACECVGVCVYVGVCVWVCVCVCGCVCGCVGVWGGRGVGEKDKGATNHVHIFGCDKQSHTHSLLYMQFLFLPPSLPLLPLTPLLFFGRYVVSPTLAIAIAAKGEDGAMLSEHSCVGLPHCHLASWHS